MTLEQSSMLVYAMRSQGSARITVKYPVESGPYEPVGTKVSSQPSGGGRELAITVHADAPARGGQALPDRRRVGHRVRRL